MLARVNLRAAAFALCTTLVPGITSLGTAGCRSRGETGLIAPGPRVDVENLDDFEFALNRYSELAPGSAERGDQRAQLLAFLSRYAGARLTAGDEGEAIQALRYGATLFAPSELRDDRIGAAPLAPVAAGLYRLTARRGAETPSLLALAVLQRFGDESARKRALEEWRILEDWVVRNGPYAADPLLRHEELEHALGDVAAVFPSPFVVKRLADLYIARYQSALKLREFDAGNATRRRLEFTGVLLMRLYLRADDVDGARAAMARIELDILAAKLRTLMEDAFKTRRTPTALLAFAEQFAPEPGANTDDPYTIQGWGIVDVLSRRALSQHPKDAYAHLLRARSLRHAGLGRAAIAHLRRCIELKEDVFAAWQELARLEQRELERLAARDPKAAALRLPDIERMHGRATQLWSDRPIQPGMPEAFFTVAEGLYEAGEASRAVTLLQRSVKIEPAPTSLDLLGTIALKQSNLREAQNRYEDLANLAYDNPVTQLQWEARARQQLGEIALRRGDAAESMRHIRMALRHTNELLARPGEDMGDRAARLIERGKLLFYLGDTELAMADFARATELAPGDVKVYTDPLIAVVSHGYYDQARTIYRRAMARSDLSPMLKLYYSLWLNELGHRQGHALEPEAEQYIASYHGDAWLELLAQHAQGRIGFGKLEQAAHDRGHLAEAYFYEALRRWRAGQRDSSRELLRKVIQTGMMGFFEYDMAQAYLAWDEVPTRARMPMAQR